MTSLEFQSNIGCVGEYNINAHLHNYDEESVKKAWDETPLIKVTVDQLQDTVSGLERTKTTNARSLKFWNSLPVIIESVEMTGKRISDSSQYSLIENSISQTRIKRCIEKHFSLFYRGDR